MNSFFVALSAILISLGLGYEWGRPSPAPLLPVRRPLAWSKVFMHVMDCESCSHANKHPNGSRDQVSTHQNANERDGCARLVLAA